MGDVFPNILMFYHLVFLILYFEFKVPNNPGNPYENGKDNAGKECKFDCAFLIIQNK